MRAQAAHARWWWWRGVITSVGHTFTQQPEVAVTPGRPLSTLRCTWEKLHSLRGCRFWKTRPLWPLSSPPATAPGHVGLVSLKPTTLSRLRVSAPAFPFVWNVLLPEFGGGGPPRPSGLSMATPHHSWSHHRDLPLACHRTQEIHGRLSPQPFPQLPSCSWDPVTPWGQELEGPP